MLLYYGEQARGQLTGHLIDQRAELLLTLRRMARGLTLLGSPGSAVSDAVREITPVLEGLRRLIKPAPITAATAQDLANLIGRAGTRTTSN
jgi:hypothetical protein